MKETTQYATQLRIDFNRLSNGTVEKFIPDLFYIVDYETRQIEFLNNSIEKLLGYSKQEIDEMSLNALTHLCHPDDIPKVHSHVQLIHDLADDEIACLDFRIRSKSGLWVSVLTQDIVYERDKKGHVVSQIGTAKNVSPQKQAEQRALKSEHIAKSIDEDLHAFVYSMSHDFKSPTHSISYLLSTLIEDYGHEMPPGARELIDIGLQTSNRMCAMVNDTFEYSKVIGEKTKFTSVDLNQVTTTLIHDMSQMVTKFDATIQVESLPEVLASQDQLTIFLRNIIENSMTYCPTHRKPLIKIFAEPTEAPEFCRLLIQDNGTGIPKSQIAKATQLFKRIHTGGQYTGSGLGLAICKRICLNHSSDLHIESIVDEGSTFSIQLEIASPKN